MQATTIDQTQARAEQAAIEATEAYQLEQLRQAFELIEAELFALEASQEQVDEVEAMRAAGLHVDSYRAAAQERNATTQCADGSYW